MQIRLSMVLFGDSPPAGMDLGMIGTHQVIARKTNEPVDEPIYVTKEGDYWRVCDGRHRAMGHMAGGRYFIEAEICTDPDHEHFSPASDFAPFLNA